MPRQIKESLQALTSRGHRVADVPVEQSRHPGLYAFHGASGVWAQLQLGEPPDSRPLYVGKAESSLASRDLEVHFGHRPRGKQSVTGSSTVRRSLAALLAPALGFRGIPRNPSNPGHFSSFGLSEADDAKLSSWMERNLTLAIWPHVDVPQLDALETAVLAFLLPPLNISKITTPWTAEIKAARKDLASEAAS